MTLSSSFIFTDIQTKNAGNKFVPIPGPMLLGHVIANSASALTMNLSIVYHTNSHGIRENDDRSIAHTTQQGLLLAALGRWFIPHESIHRAFSYEGSCCDMRMA